MKKSQKKSQKSVNNIMKENGITKNKLMLKMVKDNKAIIPILYSSVGVLIFTIVYIAAILYYLTKLNNCTCFQVKNKINYSNISYLIVIETILLILYIFMLMTILYTISMVKNVKSGGSKSINPGHLIGLIIFVLIYGYFIFYVYKLYQNIDEDCECTQSWLRYLLYIQAILMLFTLVTQVYTVTNSLL